MTQPLIYTIQKSSKPLSTEERNTLIGIKEMLRDSTIHGAAEGIAIIETILQNEDAEAAA